MRHKNRSKQCSGGSLYLVATLALIPWWPGTQLAAQAPARSPGSVVQTGAVEGVVVDSATGSPVPAARVRLIELHLDELTHEDGAFAFTGVPAGTYTLVVQRIGYRRRTSSVQVRRDDVTRLRVEMPTAVVQLAPTVVTGTVSERPGEEVLSPTSVVSGAELDRRTEGTVAATLQNEPGVAVTSLGPATARPVIRGLGGDRILLLEDGMRPGDLSSTSGDHAVAIEPLTAKQVEVVRGPMSLLYGSSALGGVVNVVRDEVPTSLPEHTHGALSLQGSSVNRGATVGGYATTRLGQFALRGEATLRNSEDVETPIGELVNTEARSYNLSAGAAYAGEWGHAGAAYRYYNNDYGIPGGFVGGHEEGVNVEMRRHTGRFESDLHLRERAFSNLHMGATFTDYYHAELESGGVLGTEFGQQFASADFVAQHNALGPFALGAVGVRGQYRDITTGGSLRTPSTYDYTFAGFAVEEIGRGPVRVQAGLRYDWARYVPRDTAAFVSVGGERIPVRPRTFGSVSGSLGLLYNAWEGVRVGASVSRAYRTPDFNELYSNGPHLAANSFDVGDPSLDQETGLGVDVFARVTRERVRAEAAVFRNHMSDYIFPSSRGRAELGAQGGRPRLQYTNEDALLTGFEGDAEWSVTPSVVLEGTVSYVRAKFTSERDPIALIEGTDTTFIDASPYPPFIPPLTGRVAVRYERSRYFVGAGVRMAARQERLGDFEEPTASYAVGSLTAGVRLLAGSRLHTVTLRVDNLLDTEYRDHLSRVKEIMPEPGRDISVLYRLTF